MNETKIAAAQADQDMKEQASQHGGRPRQILGAKLASLSDAAKEEVGNMESVKRRLREQAQGLQPQEPASARDVEVPPELQALHGGEHVFLQYDSGRDAVEGSCRPRPFIRDRKAPPGACSGRLVVC